MEFMACESCGVVFLAPYKEERTELYASVMAGVSVFWGECAQCRLQDENGMPRKPWHGKEGEVKPLVAQELDIEYVKKADVPPHMPVE